MVAAFIRYLRGVDERGEEIVLNDNRADELRRLARENPRDPRPVLGVQRVFGDLGEREAWVSELSAAIQELDARGARASVVAALSSSGQPV